MHQPPARVAVNCPRPTPAKTRAIIARATRSGNDEIRMILLAISGPSNKNCPDYGYVVCS